MSDLSSDNIGLFNYSRKSEWRRFRPDSSFAREL